ncbi:hypothetical protein [Zobellia nedashkovskayae]|uniref:hypothetical protein n=1 Tax=Zobellia nedashkovskayae TaxID=2779510 RepID=UPI00188D6EF2|nr:hypothetical protein [Zobellia nedashkovskayae]
MKKKLKEELRKLSTDIITARDMDMSEMYDVAKKLYEKLAVLKYIEEQLNDIEIDVSKNVIAAKFEKMANAVLNENASVPESNPHQEDIMIPGMDTIKDMVSEMPSHNQRVDEVLEEFLSKPDYMKNDQELFEPQKPVAPQQNGAAPKKEVHTKSLNDKISNKELKIDLNNRLAFVKHLFNGSMEDYNRVLSQLNTIDSEERSIAFINNMVRPDYNNWTGKEEYAERFMQFIERKFS